MLNIYKYYDDAKTLPGIEQYKQKLLSKGELLKIVLFARDILRGRWPEAEPYIIKDPYFAYLYASSVLKSRWLDAEEIIKTDEVSWRVYKKQFGIE